LDFSPNWWEGTLSKEDLYRENAAQSVDLAHRASSTADKSRLMALAERWLQLAEKARSHWGSLRRSNLDDGLPS
jgi:hypothetical protein